MYAYNLPDILMRRSFITITRRNYYRNWVKSDLLAIVKNYYIGNY